MKIIWTLAILSYIAAWVLAITTYSGELVDFVFIFCLSFFGGFALIHYITYGRKGVKE